MKDNLSYVDDTVVMYHAGRTLVLYSTDTRTQRFIQGTETTDGITALALSPSRKYLAIAERAERGLITVYDLTTLKRRKVLASSELGSKVRAKPADRLAGTAWVTLAPRRDAGVRVAIIFCGWQAHRGAGGGSRVEPDNVAVGEGEAVLRHQAGA